MDETVKSATRHRTASILMAAVLVFSLVLYAASEYVLRRAMVKPINREKVDFAKALDWLPPKAKKELEYRARYLDLKQKYEMAKEGPAKFNAAYQFALHTRDINEHNEVLLPYTRHPEKYAAIPNIHRAFVQMLYDPKNPKAISIQQYYDFLNTRKEPLELFNLWNDGRTRLNKVAGRNAPRVTTEFLKPLLDKPLDYFVIREYTWCLNQLKNNARRLSVDASRRIADKRELAGDAETAASMMKLAIRAEALQKQITANPCCYSRGEYIRKEKARLAYENLKPGQDPLKLGFDYARFLKDPAKRKLLVQNILKKTSAAENHPLRLRLYALQADQIGRSNGLLSAKEYLAFADSQKTSAGIFLFWRETMNRLNGIRSSSAVKLQILEPLMQKSLKECPFRDYAAFYDQIARCAVYLNRQELFEKASEMCARIRKSGHPSFAEYQKKSAGNQKKK